MMENRKCKMTNGGRSPLRAFPFSIFHIPFAIFILYGCGPKQPEKKAPYIGPTESIYDVVEAVNKNNRRLPTLWANVSEMDASIVDDSGKRHDEVLSGGLLYRAPREVLLKGSKDVVGEVVQIGSNTDTYWLTAKSPGPDTAWWGRYKYLGSPCVKPIPIRPDLVLEVLGISTINEDFNALPAPVMRFNNDADAYMLTWNSKLPDRWVAVKEVWYDRQTKRPMLVLLFDVDGRVLLRAKLSQHKPVELPDGDKATWPTVATRYELFFPDSGSKLRLQLDDVKLSRKGAPNDASFRFSPQRAGVAKVIQLDEDCGD
jgi:hypothetical protein